MIGIFLMLICLGAYFYTKRFKYWESRGVKQNYVFPPFGDNFEPMLKGLAFGDLIKMLYDKFPNSRYLGLYQFNKPVLMLRDPELIKKMLVKDFEHFTNHEFLSENTDPLWCKCIFVLKGQQWKDMRAIISPLFTGSKIRQIFTLMLENAEKFVNYFSKTNNEIVEIEFKDAVTRYTNDIITNTAFGIKCDSLNDPNNEFFVRGKQSLNFFGFWKNIKFIIIEMLPLLKKFSTTQSYDEEVTMFFRKIVKEIVEYREQNSSDNHDVISALMSKKKQQENSEIEEFPSTLDDIAAQALLLFIAGLETTSTTICFMAYELALNPDIQNRLIRELDQDRMNNKILTYENIGNLQYLDMVLSETLRKWSSNYVTDRKCTKLYEIEPENPDEKPVFLNENDTLWVPIWALHHDSKYWENPGKFDPERFSPENKEKIVPFSYIPFGLGPRGCIGSRFATIEIKILFYKILEKFEFVPVDKTVIPFVPSKTTFNLSPGKEFWLGLKKREVFE